MPQRIFLLSPAHCGGERAKLLFRPEARFELAMQVRTPAGAPLGNVFSFLSGLYFRGKLAYSRRFANVPQQICGQQVITTNRGLVAADVCVTLTDLRNMGAVDIHPDDHRYRRPLLRATKALCERLPTDCEIVLLGSVASGKYVDVLTKVFRERLLFPRDFLGRGDMSRGGLMLRCVDSGSELEYLPVLGAVRRGKRPAKLLPRVSIKAGLSDFPPIAH